MRNHIKKPFILNVNAKGKKILYVIIILTRTILVFHLTIFMTFFPRLTVKYLWKALTIAKKYL